MARRPDDAALEASLGHGFADRALLDEALTHVSAGAERGPASYQRLEFLGDRVLGLAVADLVYRRFPAAGEGEMSRRLAALVRRETCAEVAQAWKVGPHLRLGAGEVQSGGRGNATILADACEALIGAVYLDAGYEAARAVIERAFGPHLAASRRPLRDPKTALQEWAQGRGLPTPTYALLDRSGPDHAPTFRIVARVGMAEATGVADCVGEGASKRAAEQDAARNLLRREGVCDESAPDEAEHV